MASKDIGDLEQSFSNLSIEAEATNPLTPSSASSPMLLEEDAMDLDQPFTQLSLSSPPTPPPQPDPVKKSKPKRPTCAIKGCKGRLLTIAGDCDECKKSFCSKHRLLESHDCPGLEKVRKNARIEHSEKMNREATQMVKVDA